MVSLQDCETSEIISSSSARGSSRARGEMYACARLHRARSVAQLAASNNANVTAREVTWRIGLTRHKISDRARARVWLQAGRTSYTKARHRSGRGSLHR